METTDPASGAGGARRYDLDWLRVLVVAAVFVFHSSRFFDVGDWHVKNATTYRAVQLWTTFLGNWTMPLIFLISGASTWYALGSRSAGRFVKDRALRLLVPLVVGIFSHVLVQVYLERISHRQWRGSLPAFVPHYFDGLYGFGGNFAWMGLHLWYLEVLFMYSVALLPLLGWLRRGRGQASAARLTGAVAGPVSLYLPALPVVLLLNTLDPASAAGQRNFGGWSLVVYLLFFVYGFLLMGSADLQQQIVHGRRRSLVLALLLTAAQLPLWASGAEPAFATARYSLIFSLYGLSAWCWLLASFGYALQHLNRAGRWLPVANEAVLPFYILHQSVLIGVGYFVVQWVIPDAAKWLIIVSSALVIIVALYALLVRRIGVLRFVFGMKPAPARTGRPLTDRSAYA